MKWISKVAFCACLVNAAYAQTAVVAPAKCGIDNFDQRMLDEVNKRRLSSNQVCNGKRMPAVQPLRLSTVLTQVADEHSAVMAKRARLGHDGDDGKLADSRLDKIGYDFADAGENVARWDKTIEIVVSEWIKSKTGHCETTMQENFTEFGSGCSKDFKGIPYYTQMYGLPR